MILISIGVRSKKGKIKKSKLIWTLNTDGKIHLKTEILTYMKQFGHTNHEMFLSDKVVFATYGQLRSLRLKGNGVNGES